MTTNTEMLTMKTDLVTKLERQLQSNHAGHEVLRNAATDFFEAFRLHKHQGSGTNERLLEAFRMHFFIDGSTEYSLHCELDSWVALDYSYHRPQVDGKTTLKMFAIRAKMKNIPNQFYDFFFTL